MAKKKQQHKSRDSQRRIRKKVSLLTEKKLNYVDWKDADLLRRFLSDRSKIRARRVTGNSAQQQKMCADAIKIAREMALLPYTTRVTTQRSSRDRFDRAERGDDGRERGPARDGGSYRDRGPAQDEDPTAEALPADAGQAAESRFGPAATGDRESVEAQA